jgi:hypothetical protein
MKMTVIVRNLPNVPDEHWNLPRFESLMTVESRNNLVMHPKKVLNSIIRIYVK